MAIAHGPAASGISKRRALSADRFCLRGRSVTLDPRIHAYRPDLADVALAGTLFAPHYARAETRSCVMTTTPVRNRPSSAASSVSELILGEEFAIVDIAGGWAWGYSLHDHYVGYVETAALGEVPAATHIVSAAAALIFALPDIKSPVLQRLPMGARICGRREGAFVALADGFAHVRHVTGLDIPAHDPVAIAEALIGTPYRWGGRSGDGIDCSGLVQLAFALCGRPMPRDSDQQAVSAGDPICDDEPSRRGDLIFFPGHVGLMADANTLVHANAHWMAVVAEPLSNVLARGTTITARRRP